MFFNLFHLQPKVAQSTCLKMYLDVMKQNSVTRGGQKSKEDHISLNIHLMTEIWL